MTGCVSLPEITPEQASMTRSELATKSTCYQSQQMMSGQMWGALGQIPEGERAMAVMMMANQQNNAQMLAVATGKSLDPCSGDSNFHDVEIAYLNAQTNLIGQYIDGAKWGVGLGLGYAAWNTTVHALADAGGTFYSASQNAKLNVNSQNKDSWNTAGNDVVTSGDHNLVNNNNDAIDSYNGDNPEGEVFDEEFSTESRRIQTCETSEDCLEDWSCVDKVCIENPSTDPVEPVEPEFSIEECLARPPFGLNEFGTPLFSPNCSCKSKWQGQC